MAARRKKAKRTTTRTRRTTYTPAVADAICERLAEGESLRGVCQDLAMPSKSSVMTWLRDREDFREQYELARQLQAEGYAAEIVAIADEATTHETAAVARVRVDARKWVVSKLLPKKYGDYARHEVAVGGPVDVALDWTPLTGGKVFEGGPSGDIEDEEE